MASCREPKAATRQSRRAFRWARDCASCPTTRAPRVRSIPNTTRCCRTAACRTGPDSTDGEHMTEARISPPGGHYSHGTVANGFVFVSGQLPITPTGEKLAGASFDAQARQVLANVAAVLASCGSGIDRLVQV